MSDQARFWFWIVALALMCLILGAVLASAARAQGVLAEPTFCNQAPPHRPPAVAIVSPPRSRDDTDRLFRAA
jgi:hypothetical protein